MEYKDYQKAADYILSKIDYIPEVAIVLGSCLGNIADEITDSVKIDYSDIPNFLLTTVSSHAGKLILGTLSGKKVVCMSGRFHYYEGYDFEKLDIPMRVMKLLGVKSVILTNAAGGVNRDFVPGDIMIIKDHIKLNGASPLRGKNIEQFGDRFFDMSNAYDKNYITLVKSVAEKSDIDIKEGVYFYMPGPQFETPAEINAIRILGADAVGMSTVTESIVATHCGLKVIGLSLISNMAAGVRDEKLTVEEVDETAEKTEEKFKKLIRNLLKEM